MTNAALFPTCESGGMSVRPFEQSDAEAMYGLVRVSGDAINGPGAVFNRQIGSVDDYALSMDRLVRRQKASPAVVQLDGAYIGFVGMWDGDRPTVELMYWLGASFQGRGLGTRALGLVTPTIHDAGYEGIRLRITSGNIGSRRIAQKVGYVLTHAPKSEGGYEHWYHGKTMSVARVA